MRKSNANKASTNGFAKALKEAQKSPAFEKEVTKFVRAATHIYKLN